jgi:ribonuclease HI
MFQDPYWGPVGSSKSVDNQDGDKIYGEVISPGWECFLPAGAGIPRALTYVRTDITQLSAALSPDMVRHNCIVPVDITYGSKACLLINVYNPSIEATGPGATLRSLMATELDLGLPTVLAGDFNLHHSRWNLGGGGNNERMATDLLEWTETGGLDLQVDGSAATRQGGPGQRDSVLDLVFWNDTLFQDYFGELEISWSDNLDSDHAFLSWVINLAPEEAPDAEVPAAFVINEEKQEDWTLACHAYLADHPVGVLDCPRAIDNAATHLRAAFDSATEATMKPRKQCQSTRAKEWWNGPLDDQVARLRYARTPLEKAAARNRLKRLARRTSKEFYGAKMSNLTADKLPQAIKCAQGRKAKKTPPIATDHGSATTAQEKAQAFANSFFFSDIPPAADLTEDELEQRDERGHQPFSWDELEEALRSCSNTSAPGVSGIGYRLIKWGGVEVMDYLRRIYDACLNHGHHPKQWREALIAIVAKPRKADMSNPRSYRPIALLECFSKLLEKVQATRIQYEIGKHGLLGTNQFGCRMKSSCVDAGLTLCHDVHVAWSKGQVASALMFDIKGFFDNIQHSRLIQLLRRLGFSSKMCQWVTAFLTNRIVHVKVDGVVTNPIELRKVGVPQGSPLSPILAALYTSPTLNMCHQRPGTALSYYVDDGLIIAVSPSLETNCQMLSEAHAAVAGSLMAAGLPTDPQKNELIHFAHRWPEHPPSALIKDNAGQPLRVLPQKVVRWLGFYLDHNLNFKEHIRRMANAAMSVVKMLNILGNSIRGASMLNRRTAYKMVVLPVLTYGAPLYYHAQTPRSHVSILDRVQNAGLRMMTGCFRTTSGRAMRHIGAIIPIRCYLQKLHDGAAIRLRSLTSDSQPVTRLPQLWRPASYPAPTRAPGPDTKRMKGLARRSPLLRLAKSSGLRNATDERTAPFQTAPWEPTNKWGNRVTISQFPQAKGGEGKKMRKKEIENLMEQSRTDESLIVCFTDGSRHARNSASKRTGAAYSILYGGNEVAKGAYGLGKRSNIYDAELCALTGTASRLRQMVQTYPAIKQIVIFADSSSAIGAAIDPRPHPGQQFSLLFRSHVDSLFDLTQGDLRIEVKWTPGHAGVFGNELVDRRAKEAASLRPVAGGTIAYARERASRRTLKVWQEAWLEHPKSSWSDVGLSLPPSTRPDQIWHEVGDDRALSSRLAQILTGHGHFGDYYRRFVPTERPGCSCGADVQSREHILGQCPLYDHVRHHLEKVDPHLSLPTILGTLEGRQALVAFLRDSDAFQKKREGEEASQPPPSVVPEPTNT